MTDFVVVQHVTCRAFSGRMGGDIRDFGLYQNIIELVDH
jgi:hypothetical protein